MNFFGLSWKALISQIRALRRRQQVAAIYSTVLTSRCGRGLSGSEMDWITDLTADTLWLLDQQSEGETTLRIGLAPWCVLLDGLSIAAAYNTVNDLNRQLQHRFKSTEPVLYLVPQTISGHTLQ